MQDDDNVCLCFHVTKRKVTQFIRAEKPKRLSQVSQCYGAGTGCGWCRPILKQLFDSQSPETEVLPTPEIYAEQRRQFRKKQASTD